MVSFWEWEKAEDAKWLMKDFGFVKKPAAHTKSRLMQLPAEIRLMILRELLVGDKPLAGQKFARKKGVSVQESTINAIAATAADVKTLTLVQGYTLAPMMLASCQLLLKEGHPILYGENTLTVGLHTKDMIPSSCVELCRLAPNCKYCAACSFVSALADGVNLDPLHGQCWIPKPSTSAFISQFQHLNFYIHLMLHSEAYDIPKRWMEVMAATVPNKSDAVTIRAGLGRYSILPSSIRDLPLTNTKDFVNLFWLWRRCTVFLIKASPLHVLYDLTPLQATIEAVQKLATSPDPVDDLSDLEKEAEKLYTMVHVHLVKTRFRDYAIGLRDKAVAAIRAFDREEFLALRAELWEVHANMTVSRWRRRRQIYQQFWRSG